MEKLKQIKSKIIRDGAVIFTGEIQTLYREKNQVKEVGTGLECGIGIKDFIDFKEKDIIESFLAEEIKKIDLTDEQSINTKTIFSKTAKSW